MSAFTTGPWSIRGTRSYIGIYGPRWRPIAQVPAKGDGVESTANANLISAAPELLECVKYLCDELESHIDHDDETTTPVRHLIAKAEGRTP